jgi:hypothetical protein
VEGGYITGTRTDWTSRLASVYVDERGSGRNHESCSSTVGRQIHRKTTSAVGVKRLEAHWSDGSRSQGWAPEIAVTKLRGKQRGGGWAVTSTINKCYRR